ncbi:MAG TPA: endolytic transglycosylase MltG [Geobacteraceae bacterium]|nr:endolytic transglycosylase MltG [Geobacteraceae bacterium]
MKFTLPKKSRTPILIAAIFTLLVFPALFGLFLVSSPGDGRNVQILDFGKGQSLRRFASILKERKIISSAGLFIIYARLSGEDARVKAGFYQVNDAMTPIEILRRMVAGEVYEMRFAVPEGYSIYQVAELLAGRRLFDRETFLRECCSGPLLRELGIAGKSAEGYLYPCTYDITPDMTAADLVRLMVGQFDKVYARDFAGLAQGTHLSKREIITLASMVEKEAVRPEERPLIASVFLNRLQRRMPLQSDPTAVYGVRAFAGNVSKQDITRPSPYNTYLISGLPPGPIGNPGRAAIGAVLKPAATRYLYFVAKKDGSHFFSTTLDEHNRAVRTYLK